MEDVKAIAIGALTSHWPVHLGLITDADKIEWLARQVEKLADDVDEYDGEGDRLQREAETLEDRLRVRNTLVEDLNECTDCKLCDGHKKDVAQ